MDAKQIGPSVEYWEHIIRRREIQFTIVLIAGMLFLVALAIIRAHFP